MSDSLSIGGWGNFNEIHEFVFKNLPDNATIIELGVANGRGLATMIKVAERLQRNFHIFGIDNFIGSGEEWQDKFYSNLSFNNVVNNLNKIGIKNDQYKILISDTVKAAELFKEVNYVFVDADHSYKGVSRDIDIWWPKIVQGGYIGGHDWPFESVNKAVIERFKEPTIITDCWLHRKSESSGWQNSRK